MSMNLEDVKVVELAHWWAGPLAGQILGEWGADVIHVEKTGSGDVTRGLGPFYKGKSMYFGTVNRDKRSVTLNVKSEEGVEVLLDLIEKADVFVTNYTAAYLERCGITYERIHERNPRIVACYISGFGLTGRYKDKKALDMVMQAMSGQMSCNGDPDGIPYKTGTITADYGGAYQAVIGILTALHARDCTGEGRLVDVAITDALICGLEWRIPEYRLTGKTSGRIGNRRPTIAPCNLYRTKDGYVYISASSQKMYENMVKAMGDERFDNEKFYTNQNRLANLDELEEIILDWLKDKETDWVVDTMEKAGVPCGPLLTPVDLAEGDYVDEKELVVTVDDPELGEAIPVMGSPIKMDKGYRHQHMAPPALGQHNSEVYKEWLGWDADKLSAMQKKGII